jgi:hypothetical protein
MMTITLFTCRTKKEQGGSHKNLIKRKEPVEKTIGDSSDDAGYQTVEFLQQVA